MAQQAEMLYLLVLVIFLVLLRSPWPWTRAGGLVLLAAGVAAALAGGRGLAEAAFESRRLPASALAVLTAVVVWWSLHAAQRGRRSEPVAGSAAATSRHPARLRLAGAALGVAAVGLLAAHLGAPPPARSPEQPWFLAGLFALAPSVGELYALGLVPAAAACGLLLAPSLDTRDPDAEAAHDGRRDEVPFFAVRFWLDFLGVRPPAWWALRELPGLVLYLAVFAFLPWWLPTWRATKGVFGRHRRRLGRRRYALMMAVTGVMALVPVKVALSVLLSIGPWLVLPGGLGL